ncbi:MAG: hypothetical protein DDT19_02416 [Syntrophomonadaceae bacterium]|nr:hypothetical protein [Bacillota bacterium]
MRVKVFGSGLHLCIRKMLKANRFSHYLFWESLVSLIFKLLSSAIVLICVSIFTFSISYGVPVVPNKAVLEGTVKESCISSAGILGISPEQVIYKLTISVESTKDVGDFPNFLKGKEGQNQTFYTKEKPSSELFGKRIRAQAEYIGDERKGRFWIKSIEILP